MFSIDQFWDGRAGGLEEQAKGPLINPIEMGFTHEGIVSRVREVAGYRRQFAAVFGTEEVTIDLVAQSLAAFERTLLSGNSPFDRFTAGDSTAMSDSAQRGLALFRGRTECFRCHVGFNFTDENYRNIGVGIDEAEADVGRMAVTERPEHVALSKRRRFGMSHLRHLTSMTAVLERWKRSSTTTTGAA